MNEPNESDRERDAGERFARRLAEHYRPETLTRVQRARFDARLFERIEHRRRAPAWMPSLAGIAAALLVAWLVWPVATPPEPVQMAALDTTWETDVLLVDEDTTLSEEDYLPDEYQAIALAFIDGV